MEEQCVTPGGLTGSAGGAAGSKPISGSEVASGVLSVVGQPNSTKKRGESRVTEETAAEWAGEGGWRKWSGRERKPESKGVEEEQFHE